LHRRRDDDPVPIALEDRARHRVAEVFAEGVAETLVAEHRLQLIAVIGLDRVEGRMAVERIGRRQGEIERQRLAGKLEINLLPALLRRGAGLEHAHSALGELLVVEGKPGGHEDAAAVSAGTVPEAISTTPRPGPPIAPTSASNSPMSLIVDGIGMPPHPEWLGE